MYGEFIELSNVEALEFLLPRHYSGRAPNISKAFGWIIDGELMAVCTFGKPASNALCEGLCGKENSKHVYELNRLCRKETLTYPISQFVGKCLRYLKQFDWIIVSYSDTAMHHNGYIYQACNFLYTGQSKPQLDGYAGGGKHSRSCTSENRKSPIKQIRSPKNRYVYFCTSNKKLKNKWMSELQYPIQPYPKEENQNYVLGDFMKPQLVDTSTNERYEDDSVEHKEVMEQLNLFFNI